MTTALKSNVCGWCRKPLGDMTVGLNGKEYHLRPCFEAACAAAGSVVRQNIARMIGGREQRQGGLTAEPKKP